MDLTISGKDPATPPCPLRLSVGAGEEQGGWHILKALRLKRRGWGP